MVSEAHETLTTYVSILISTFVYALEVRLALYGSEINLVQPQGSSGVVKRLVPLAPLGALLPFAQNNLP